MPEPEKTKTLYIVDGTAYIYRAFFAVRSLTNATGMPTNAIYGFTQMLRKLLEEQRPDYLAMTFDAAGARENTFRSALYPDYKAHRPPMPDDLRLQMPYFRQIVDAFNIPIYEDANVEADDLIATLTRLALDVDLCVCIVSADKDLMQLIKRDRVSMIDTMRDKVFDEDAVIKRFGVPPNQVRHVLALAGDTSDNIPGVPGIGEKTGGQLISAFGDLESVLENIENISGKKRKENLITFADQARLSLALVTLKDDCTVSFSEARVRTGPPDLGKLEPLFESLDFRGPLRSIRSWMNRRGWALSEQTDDGAVKPELPEKTEPNYRTCLTLKSLGEVIALCEDAPLFSFDLETTSLSARHADIVGFSLAWAPHEAAYIPVAHRELSSPKQLDLQTVLDRLRPLLESEEQTAVGQNLKYDMTVLRRYGITPRGFRWDTMLMSYLLDPGKSSHGLDAIARDILNHKMITYAEVAGKGSAQLTFDLVDIPRAAQYAAADADLTLQVAQAMAPLLAQTKLQSIHDEIELPLAKILIDIEAAGLRLDTLILAQLSDLFRGELEALLRQIHDIAGSELNPNSPKQLRQVLFEQLGLPIKKRTRTGPSTDQSVLEQLSPLHELPALILDYRSFAKLKSTYVDALPSLVEQTTGRIHTQFNQSVAATGRLSSSHPNLQNIPIRSERGREIRRAFVASQQHILLCADYSQIELRIMAHMSSDPALTEAFLSGIDVHRRTAAQIFGVADSAVTDEERRVGKTINFGVMYGMGANRLARQLKIKRGTAKTYIDQYFLQYQGVKSFFDRLVNEGRTRGFAETLSGRRRSLDHINGSGAQRAFAERVAVNMPIQGTAADIIKIAMIKVHAELTRSRLPCKMVLQVHDELVFEVHEDAVDTVKERVRTIMEGAYPLRVPLPVDIGVGINWLDAK
jgi:DNA polymerase I